MVIIDTSVWVDSMRLRDERVSTWIAADQILQHPFVTAEIGMGSFRSAVARSHMIDLLESFDQIQIVTDQDFHTFVATNELFGTGIGFADAHLLQACVTHPNAPLVTRDNRLVKQAERLGIVLQ